MGGGQPSTREDGPTILHGVSLAQLAAVKAAVAEGFPLQEVLAIEEIDRRVFRDAELAWMDRLGQDEPLFERYRGELAAAEDWLIRLVSPLDTDLAAWVAFQTAFGSPDASADLLRRTGLGTNDVSRLARSWSRRIEEDSGLRKRAAQLGEKREHGALPPITADPPKLCRSRAFKPVPRPTRARAAPPAASAAPPVPDAGGTLDVAAILQRPALPFAAAAPAAEALHRAEAHAAAVQGPAAPPEPADAGGTLEVGAILARAPLPFGAAQPSAAPAATAPPHPEPDAGGTVEVGAILARAPLPFTRQPAAVPDVAPAPAPRAPPAPHPDAGGTLEVGAILARAPLPFAKPASVPPPASERPAEPPVELSLQQYASLCVEILLDPPHVAEALARYRISPARRASLDAHWRGRFAADPALYDEYGRACATYRAWLLQNRR